MDVTAETAIDVCAHADGVGGLALTYDPGRSPLLPRAFRAGCATSGAE